MPAHLSTFPTRPFVGPGRTVHGLGSSATIGAELIAVGVRREHGVVLVVADAALIGLDLVRPIAEAITGEGFAVRVGPGVAGEPTPETVQGLLASAGEETIVAVVAVGGGSAIDAAKLVAAGATNELELTVGLAPTVALADGPVLAAVPTTAGTGAEATAVAMLWHEGRKRIFVNERLVPRHATLDATLMRALPPAVMAASGLDAISHAVESLLSTFRTPLSEAAGRSALRRLAAALPAACSAPDDDVRSELLLGAHEAGLALNASVVSGHSIAYAIAARAQLSHGVTCAMALPFCLAYTRDAAPAALAEVGELAGVEATADAALEWLCALTASLKMPASLAAVGIDRADLPAMAQEIVERYPRPNSPAPLQTEPLTRLLEHFHSGDVEAAWGDAAARPGR